MQAFIPYHLRATCSPCDGSGQDFSFKTRKFSTCPYCKGQGYTKRQDADDDEE